jgi:hypothetical protein
VFYFKAAAIGGFEVQVTTDTGRCNSALRRSSRRRRRRLQRRYRRCNFSFSPSHSDAHSHALLLLSHSLPDSSLTRTAFLSEHSHTLFSFFPNVLLTISYLLSLSLCCAHSISNTAVLNSPNQNAVRIAPIPPTNSE